MQFGQVVFEIDKDKLLKQTRQLNRRLRKENEAREKGKQRERQEIEAEVRGAARCPCRGWLGGCTADTRLGWLMGVARRVVRFGGAAHLRPLPASATDTRDPPCAAQIEKAREQVRRFRNDKASVEFRVARERLKLLREALERHIAANDVKTEFESIHHRISETKQRAKAEKEERDREFKERLAQNIRKAHLLKHPHTAHPRGWNFSVNPYGQIHTPFMPLGPSRPSLLRKEGTRFGPPPKGKKAWRAVPEGLLFGYTAPPRMLQTGWGPFKEDPDMDEFDDDPASKVPGTAPARSGASELARRRQLEERRRQAKERDMDAAKRKVYSSKQGKTRPWSTGCAVPKVFSDPEYNRPMTAHERALAAKLTQADRALFKASLMGVPPWKPNSVVPRPLHSFPAHLEEELGDGARGGAGGNSVSFDPSTASVADML